MRQAFGAVSAFLSWHPHTNRYNDRVLNSCAVSITHFEPIRTDKEVKRIAVVILSSLQKPDVMLRLPP